MPLLELLEQLATSDRAPHVVLVLADFGSGKSLSARMLARRWAERALAAASVSLDEILPIYVRCAEDFPHEAVDLPATVRRAWKRQADGFGFSIPEDDDALAWPPDAQRVVCLFDGLDEIALGDQHLKTLFHKLRGRATARQRFIVFSRPGALPPRGDLGDGVAVVRVQPFEPVQIERWLAGWNQLHAGASPVALPAIETLGLGELARTPILLFMIVFTWGRYTAVTDRPSLAAIYEGFVGQIAAGKAAADRERHGPITAASEALLAALRNRGMLDERAVASDAMLWLIGRVAWQAQMLEQQHPPEALTRRHIDNLLHDEDLRLPTDALPAIQLGLVLALQSDLRSADHRILFGHQSFREFLVGRHWAAQLRRIVRGNPRDWERETDELAGGRLLGPENRAFEFLSQIIHAPADPRSPSPRAWSDPDRDALVRWAQDVFCDERQLFGSRARPARRDDTRLRDDQRATLRETALAIGSQTAGSPGLHARDPATLRSMLAWFWLHDVSPIVIAPRARLAGANLAGCELDGADFVEAILDEARLVDANLNGASLDGARLNRASLIGASLVRTSLIRASLIRASLGGASLVDARLDGANLDGASLNNANLNSASLNSASLNGAILDGTSLDGASLDGASYDEWTVWPAGFDPVAQGARLAGHTCPPPARGELSPPADASAGSPPETRRQT